MIKQEQKTRNKSVDFKSYSENLHSHKATPTLSYKSLPSKATPTRSHSMPSLKSLTDDTN